MAFLLYYISVYMYMYWGVGFLAKRTALLVRTYIFIGIMRFQRVSDIKSIFKYL